MNMKIDRYTGEPYDSDVWYRGSLGCWINKKAEAEWLCRVAEKVEERRRKRNANRVAKGKRKRSPSSFSRSAARYARYLELDTDIPFGEWLKRERMQYA